jgi:putative tricarboxylic transport membrane protein
MNAEHHKHSLDDMEVQAIRPQDAPPSSDARNASDRPGVLSEVSTFIVGVVMVALGVAVFVNARGLRAVNEPLGPGFFPTIIAVGLALVGAWLAWSGREYVLPAFSAVGDWSLDKGRIGGIAVVLVTLIMAALLMPILGFWLVATVVYTASALVLQSPRTWRVPAVGAILAGLIVLLFDRLIDLSLPAGPWGF